MDYIDRRLLVAAVIVVLAVFGLGTVYGEYRQKQNAAAEMTLTETEPDAAKEEPEPSGEIVIYVTGDVEHPGIYRLESGARVFEALEKALPKETADLRYLDLARIMVDEETLLVPAIGEQSDSGPQTSLSGGISASGKININRASAAELDQHLTGIGPTLAQRIVDYREENGPFRKIEDLKKVSGIGDKRFADIQDRIDIK